MTLEAEKVELTRDEQLDQEWDKLEAAEAAGKAPESDGLSAETDPEDEEAKLDATNTPDDSEALNKESEQTESTDAKALKDTKAWATKLAQENSELKRLMAEGATKKEIAEQEQSVEQTKKEISAETLDAVYREYPELKEVLSPLLDTLKELKTETEGIRKQKAEDADQRAKREKQEAIDNFENSIMPKVMAVHSDFKEIIGDSAFFEWAEKQRPGLKTAALQSNDPEDITWAVSEYKKSLAGAEAGKLKQTDAEKRQQKLNNQMTLRGGSSQVSTGKVKADPADYDAAWEKAEQEERKR